MDFAFTNHVKLNAKKRVICEKFAEYLVLRNELLTSHALALAMEFGSDAKFMEWSDAPKANRMLDIFTLVIADDKIYKNRRPNIDDIFNDSLSATYRVPTEFQIFIKKVIDLHGILASLVMEYSDEEELTRWETIMLTDLINPAVNDMENPVQQLLDSGEHIFIELLISYLMHKVSLEHVLTQLPPGDPFSILTIINMLLKCRHARHEEYKSHYTNWA